MTSAINTAATSERELMNEELDTVSGGVGLLQSEIEQRETGAPNIGNGVMSAVFVLARTFF
jgi:hypothetical protein